LVQFRSEWNKFQMKNVLFVCSQNRLRSPTAEQVFSGRSDIEVASAGTNHDADNPLTDELVSWADIIFVMEKAHRAKLQQNFKARLKKLESSASIFRTTMNSWIRFWFAFLRHASQSILVEDVPALLFRR
jgi:predicted protein tyrosine phosphatase